MLINSIKLNKFQIINQLVRSEEGHRQDFGSGSNIQQNFTQKLLKNCNKFI